MASINGNTKGESNLITPAPSLGKRKRTGSPELKVESSEASKPSAVQRMLEEALQIIQKYDTSGVVSRHVLSSHDEEPAAKRQRRNSNNTDTIENRILNNSYDTFDDLLKDVYQLKNDIYGSKNTNGHVNGLSVAYEKVETIWDHLLEYRRKTQIAPVIKKDTHDIIPHQTANQVLSLRSQTESGIKQLFSGLPQSAGTSIQDTVIKNLPNGFELSTITMLDRPKTTPKEKRVFGEIFAPNSRVKGLEAPRPDRRHRDLTNLSFTSNYNNMPAANKNDYKYASLSTAAWLQYATLGDVPLSVDPKSRPRESDKSVALFRAAFSSFAPTIDHSSSVVTETDRTRQWWKRYSTKTMRLDLPEGPTKEPEENIENFVPGDDFEELIANYVSENDLDHRNEAERLLDEVSELLETLSSYQTIRDSGHARGPSSANKPTKPEIDVYEMLKSQLQILISSLPPYAVAKLNGDQLASLNISSHLQVTPSEFAGTSQADEYTLRKIKAATTVTNVPGRPNPPMRNNYSTPAVAYNAQAQTYNRNVPATAYAPRQSGAMYHTPRATGPAQTAPYSQPNYRSGTGTYANATIQQFQRAQGLAPGTVVSPYMQKPTQPGYQQRAQDNGTAFTRSDSSNQPTTNGQHAQSQQARQYAGQLAAYAAQQSQGPVNQTQSQQTGQYRQTSGTPQPQDTIVAAPQSVAGTV